MPLYVIGDRKTGESKEVLMHFSEYQKHTKRDERGFRIYEGDSFGEVDTNGRFVFLLTTPSVTANKAGYPLATRKLGDKHTSPNFNQKPWV